MLWHLAWLSMLNVPDVPEETFIQNPCMAGTYLVEAGEPIPDVQLYVS